MIDDENFEFKLLDMTTLEFFIDKFKLNSIIKENLKLSFDQSNIANILGNNTNSFFSYFKVNGKSLNVLFVDILEVITDIFDDIDKFMFDTITVILNMNDPARIDQLKSIIESFIQPLLEGFLGGNN